MRHVTMFWVLLMKAIFAVCARDDSFFERPRCRSGTNCVEKNSSAEKFSYKVKGYQIILSFHDTEKFLLWCNIEKQSAIPVNDPDLPVMSRPVEVKEVKIRGCLVPSNGSYAEALEIMNVATTGSLFLSQMPTNPQLERHHLRGLKISNLKITPNDPINPPRPKHDYLEDLELRNLRLESIAPEPESLMLLPATLESLVLQYTEFHTAEHALGKGGAWLERLHSLRFLQIVESSEIATKTPGFITLPKLVHLPNLTKLSLHFLTLNSSNLSDSLNDSSINILVLVSCGLNYLPNTVFEGVNLTSLSLTNNNLTVTEDVFSSLRWLTYLDLSDNQLSGEVLVRILSPLTHARLKTLKANDNPLGSLCDPDTGSAKWEPGLPKTLEWLELQGTSADRICSDWIENDALMHVDLHNNNIGNLSYNDLKMKRSVHETKPVSLDLTNNPNLRMINISGADVGQCRNNSLLSSEDFNNRTRARVKLKLDLLVCDCSAYWLREAVHACSLDLERDVKCIPEPHAPAETTLLAYDFNGIHCQYNDVCLPECSCWKRPRDNATIVRCAHAPPQDQQWPPSAREWPLVLHFAPDTLANVPRTPLVEFHAPNNNIASIEEMTIDDSLRVLDLRNNSIEHISEATAKKLSAVRAQRSMYLAGNLFGCSCSDAPAFEILNQVVRDWNETQCVDHSNVSEKTESELCSSILVPVLVIVITLALVLLAVGLLLLRYKARVRKFRFEHNLCIRWLITPKDKANDADKTHDVFLSYANDDRERLIELRSGLESRGYSTIEHCRDWQPGEAITVQIVRSVLCSRRTLLLVSDNYVKSKWALEEFYVAHAHAMERRTARVLIIRYNLNEPEKLPPDLRLYLKYNTYLDSNDDHFWYKLCDVLPPLRFKIDHSR